MVKREWGEGIYAGKREEKETRARDPENTNVAYRDSGNRIYILE